MINFRMVVFRYIANNCQKILDIGGNGDNCCSRAGRGEVLPLSQTPARCIMRCYKVMVVFALLWSSASLAALNFLLHSFQVNTSSVSATLRITNSTDEDVVLTFPSAGTFDLMVDGNVTTIVYPDILTELTIPAHEFVNQPVSYVGSGAFTNGSYLAQARYVLPDNPPAGDPQTFYAGTPINDVYDLEYQFSIDSVSPYRVTGTLSMHNPHSQYWTMSFGYSTVARIFVDGQAPAAAYFPIVCQLNIDPGETHTETIYHDAFTPYSPGTHYAQAYLFLTDDVPVSPPLAFYVEPVAVDDEITPPLQPLSLTLGPNPCRDMLNISSSSKESQTFSIYDLRGRLVYKTSSLGDFEWDGRDISQRPCSPGIYILKAQQGARTAIRRFVKL